MNENNVFKRSAFITFVSLFTSAGTLICCALPALLVALGLGAVLAGMVSNFPQLIWISEHKPLVFGVAAVMLGLSGLANFYSNKLPCPVDPALADACKKTRKWSNRIYILSVVIFLTGAAFAFVPALI